MARRVKSVVWSFARAHAGVFGVAPFREQILAEKANKQHHASKNAQTHSATAHAKDKQNYGADILQMMAHARKLEGHSITRSDARGTLNPLGVGSIVMFLSLQACVRWRHLQACSHVQGKPTYGIHWLNEAHELLCIPLMVVTLNALLGLCASDRARPCPCKEPSVFEA